MPNYPQSFPSEQQKLVEWQYFATDENWEEILVNGALFVSGLLVLSSHCTQLEIKKED